jgi:hypothetical protein
VSEGCCQCAGRTPCSLHSTVAGCSETQQRWIYVCAQILNVLHLKMFLLHRGQMSALHPLMKFPLHGDEMVVLLKTVAHSPHMVDELEDTPTGLKPNSCDPPNYHS